MAAAPGPSTFGVTSTSTTRRTRSGCWSASATVVSPPSDMPTTALRLRRQLADRGGDVGGVAPHAEAAVGRSVGVAVTRQVDRHERSSERHRHGVPGVGVLGAAVQQHELGRRLTPHERAEPATRRHLDLGPPDDRRAVVGESELLGVLVEEPELVVGDPVDHRCSLSERPATTLSRRWGSRRRGSRARCGCATDASSASRSSARPTASRSCGCTARPALGGRSRRRRGSWPTPAGCASSASTVPGSGSRPPTSTRTSSTSSPTSRSSSTSSASSGSPRRAVGWRARTRWRRPPACPAGCRWSVCSVAWCRASVPTRRPAGGSASPSGSSPCCRSCGTRAGSSSPGSCACSSRWVHRRWSSTPASRRRAIARCSPGRT